MAGQRRLILVGRGGGWKVVVSREGAREKTVSQVVKQIGNQLLEWWMVFDFSLIMTTIVVCVFHGRPKNLGFAHKSPDIIKRWRKHHEIAIRCERISRVYFNSANANTTIQLDS